MNIKEYVSALSNLRCPECGKPLIYRSVFEKHLDNRTFERYTNVYVCEPFAHSNSNQDVPCKFFIFSQTLINLMSQYIKNLSKLFDNSTALPYNRLIRVALTLFLQGRLR